MTTESQRHDCVVFLTIAQDPVQETTPFVEEVRGIDVEQGLEERFEEELSAFEKENGISHRRWPRVSGQLVDVFILYNTVMGHGGYAELITRKKWNRLAGECGLELATGSDVGPRIKQLYEKRLLRFEYRNNQAALQQVIKSQCRTINSPFGTPVGPSSGPSQRHMSTVIMPDSGVVRVEQVTRTGGSNNESTKSRRGDNLNER